MKTNWFIFSFIFCIAIFSCNTATNETVSKKNTLHKFDYLNASAELPSEYKEITLDDLIAKINKSEKEANKLIATQLERFKKTPFETTYFENTKSDFDYLYVQTGINTQLNQKIYKSYTDMINRSLKMGWMGNNNEVEELENKLSKDDPMTIDLVHRFTINGDDKFQSHHVVNSLNNSFSMTSVSNERLDFTETIANVKFTSPQKTK